MHIYYRKYKVSGEEGNVLFLVLIAVALFAALSFAVSRSMQSGNANSTTENRVVSGSEVTQYSTYVAQAITRMKMRGADDTALCFDSPGWGHNDYFHSGCGLASNKVFDTSPQGGGVVWAKPSRSTGISNPEWYFTGETCVPGVGNDLDDNCNSDGDSTNEDLVMFLSNIPLPLCQEINKRMGVTAANAAPPQASGDLYPSGAPKFVGIFSDGGRIDSGGSGSLDILRGRYFGCVEGGGNPPAGTYHYFHVISRR